MTRKQHHGGDYARRARAVREAAYASLGTRCWRCGLTLAEHAAHKTGKPATWQAGHVIDSDPRSPLLPEASTCNASAGATMGNHLREPPSRVWR